jgi:hypothetical protein
MPAKNQVLDMARNHNTENSPRILILGSTGRIGQAVIAELEQTPDSHQAVYNSRHRAQVDAWRGEGRMPFLSISMTPGRFRRHSSGWIVSSWRPGTRSTWSIRARRR